MSQGAGPCSQLCWVRASSVPGLGGQGRHQGCLTIKPGASWKRRGHWLPCHFTLYLAPSHIPYSHEANKRYVPGQWGFVLQRPFPMRHACLQVLLPHGARQHQSPGRPWKGARGIQENADGHCGSAWQESPLLGFGGPSAGKGGEGFYGEVRREKPLSPSPGSSQISGALMTLPIPHSKAL